MRAKVRMKYHTRVNPFLGFGWFTGIGQKKVDSAPKLNVFTALKGVK